MVRVALLGSNIGLLSKLLALEYVAAANSQVINEKALGDFEGDSTVAPKRNEFRGKHEYSRVPPKNLRK